VGKTNDNTAAGGMGTACHARVGGACVLLLVSSLAICLKAASALEPSTPLERYSRQTWLMENGLPQNTVQALAQTRDGFLWLGTEAGLVRFDGAGFQLFDRTTNPRLPGNDVRCLLESSDGALWIGTSDGLARWRNGEVTAYTTQQGLPANGIRSLVETSDKVLWAWTDSGLAHLAADRFAANDLGFPASSIAAVLLDRRGGLWVETGSGGADYRDGKWASTDEYFSTQDRTTFFASLPGGGIALASQSKLEIAHGSFSTARPQDVFTRFNVGKELPGTRIQAMMADREGSLWVGTNGGLVRVRADGKVERFPVTDSLARASILSLLEDREGNLWIGTETDGVHILRDQRFRIFDARDGLSSDAITTVVDDAAGTLWVGTREGGLNTISANAKVKTYTVRDGLSSNVILSLDAGSQGEIWAGTPDGLNRIAGGRIDVITSADGLPDDFIRSLLADADGSLWIGTRRGLTHWKSAAGAISFANAAAQMQTYTSSNGLGSDLVGAMARDAGGDLWVATLAGLSRLHAGAIENFTTANGLSSSVVTALLPRADGTLLIGTEDHGWDAWDGHEFHAQMQNGLSMGAVRAILDDKLGHLWFATQSGIARCDYAAVKDPGSMPACTHWMEFGTADGLRSRETATNSHPSAWRSRDGRLWFATPRGLVEVDPARFQVNQLPPPVAIERFTVDDLAQPPLHGAPLHGADVRTRVSAGHVHFEFDYAGLSFIAPQKVMYRYMLEGFDRSWTDAGSRRTAYYTNIPPGHYTFRVQAENNDGVWNTEGAAFSFELEPHFYQTLWFYALLLAAIAASLALLIRLRVSRAEREFKAVLGERSRIAREIHDTLAQGYVGISVQLEVLAELLRQRRVDDAQKHLNQAREQVRSDLSDARQSIWALRTQDSRETTLPVKIRRIAERAQGNGLEAHFNLFGAYRALPAETEQEILRIAQEAIHNVKKHAEASELKVQLRYLPDEVGLEVRDDGKGIETNGKLEPGPGHYGLTGMKERAAAIGGTLEVCGAPGAGTTVRLKAPAPREILEETGEPD
jgi:signal transduction histidine kinase/ligand-binding sensor domain-containing protein